MRSDRKEAAEDVEGANEMFILAGMMIYLKVY